MSNLQIPSNAILLSVYEPGIKLGDNDSLNEHKAPYKVDEKLLRSFLLGPSAKSIVLFEDNEPNNTDNTTDNTDNNTDNSSDNTQQESYHYTIYESYLKYNQKLLLERNKKKNKRQNKFEEQDKAEKPNPFKDLTDDINRKFGHEDNIKAFNNEYKTITLRVQMKDEGFTDWELALLKSADQKAILNQLKNKKFKSAFALANKSAPEGKYGLYPIGLKTYLYKNFKVNCDFPFIGHCQYAIEAGSDDNSTSNLIVAVAPIDGKTNKPNDNYVLETSFKIKGEIDNIVLKLIGNIKDAAKNGSDSRNRYDSNTPEQDSANELNDYLHKNILFKSFGNSKTYKNFLIIRQWIKGLLKDKLIELDEQDSKKSIANFKPGSKSTQIFKSANNKNIFFY